MNPGTRGDDDWPMVKEWSFKDVSRSMRFPTMWFVRQQSLRSACAYAQSDQSLCKSLEYSVSVKLLTEHHLEFLSLKGGCTGSSECTLIKMPHCWKSHVTAQLFLSLALLAILFQVRHAISNNVTWLTSVDSDEPVQPLFKPRNS